MTLKENAFKKWLNEHYIKPLKCHKSSRKHDNGQTLYEQDMLSLI